MQSPAPEPQPAPDVTASPAVLPAAACQRCGEQLEPGQEWCLECGTARPDRSWRRGREAARAVATIAVAVAVLVCGAAAASYAALTDDSSTPVAATAPPVATTAPPATTQAAPATTQATPPPTTTAKLPPIATKATLPPVPKSPTPPASTETDDDTGTTTTKKTKTETGEETSGPKTVALGAEAASVYDPYRRAIDQTDPADSYDEDPKTAFTLATAPGPATMGIGIDYDLETARTVRQVEITTTSPGFTVEVYGAEAGRPADILDPAWKHLSDAAAVATKPADKAKVTISFSPGRYRHVLLWFTTPPSAGPALAISEVRLLD